MRKMLTAAFAALLGMGVAAHAADIYDGSLKDAPVVYAPAPIWAGLYVGGHIGGLWNKEGDNELSKSRREKHKNCEKNYIPGHWKWVGKGKIWVNGYWDWDCSWSKWSQWSDWEKITDAKFKSDEDKHSLLGGVHVGYNWQNDARVYGIEGDVSFAKGIDYLASLRGRLGYAVDNTLFYGTAGIAFAGFKDKTIDVEYGPYKDSFDIEGDRKVGAVVGGGIEHKLTPRVSVGLEGLYYFFKDSSFSSVSDIDKYYGCTSKTEKQYKFDHEDSNDLFVVRARLSYHLQDSYEEPLK